MTRGLVPTTATRILVILEGDELAARVAERMLAAGACMGAATAEARGETSASSSKLVG